MKAGAFLKKKEAGRLPVPFRPPSVLSYPQHTPKSVEVSGAVIVPASVNAVSFSLLRAHLSGRVCGCVFSLPADIYY